jgi:hypothetical protein
MRKFMSKLDRVLKGRAIKPSQCLTSAIGEKLYIEDSKDLGKCVFTTPNDLAYIQRKCLTINLATESEVLLWSIDGCFSQKGKPLSADYSQKCDCAFGSDGLVCFVEFKLDANPNNPDEIIEKDRKSAVNQLTDTICFLCESLKLTDFRDLVDYQIEALICTPYPKKLTPNGDIPVKFLETYGVKLNETNSFDFELY